MIVVDASVMVSALVDDAEASHSAWLALEQESEWFSVGHLHAETVSGIRGRYLGRKITARRAEQAVIDLADLEVRIVEAPFLLGRMWELRDNVSSYDAAYIAAAEALTCPLVTKDRRLAAAPGVRCEVQLAT